MFVLLIHCSLFLVCCVFVSLLDGMLVVVDRPAAQLGAKLGGG